MQHAICEKPNIILVEESEGPDNRTRKDEELKLLVTEFECVDHVFVNVKKFDHLNLKVEKFNA